MRRFAAEFKHAVRLFVLPPRVALFQWRARRIAHRTGDAFSLMSATRPRDLALLLRLARDRSRVAELGTATAWTAIALALSDDRREVITYDPVCWPGRERYLDLVDAGVRRRIELVQAPGTAGPPPGETIDLLYIDSSHAREETIAELRTWSPALAPGALVVLDDYTHASYTGVREAVEEVGLTGSLRGTLYVHEVGADRSD